MNSWLLQNVLNEYKIWQVELRITTVPNYFLGHEKSAEQWGSGRVLRVAARNFFQPGRNFHAACTLTKYKYALSNNL